MRTLTRLYGYVAFDQNGPNAISHSNSNFCLEHLTGKIDGFDGLVTLFKRSDKSRKVSFDEHAKFKNFDLDMNVT